MVMARGVPTDGVWDAPGLTGAGPSGLSTPNGMMPSWSLGLSFSTKRATPTRLARARSMMVLTRLK